jgi:uncharacterized MnhB-related membrane protein
MNNNFTTQQYIAYSVAALLTLGSLYFIFYKYDLGLFGVCIATASIIISAVGYPSGTKKN